MPGGLPGQVPPLAHRDRSCLAVLSEVCAWCGEVLAGEIARDDSVVDFMFDAAEGHWQPGTLVREDAGERAAVGVIWEESLPIDACSAPVERS